MNVAPTPLSAGHQHLQTLVGTWHGADRRHMTLQFQPAGDERWQDMVDGVYRRLTSELKGYT